MNKVFINKDAVIEEVYVGRQNFKKVTQTAARAMVLVDQLLKEQRQVKFLVSLRKITSISADAVLAGVDALKSIYPAKMAIYGGNKLTTGLTTLAIAATGNEKNVMIFDTRLEAENWLNKN